MKPRDVFPIVGALIWFLALAAGHCAPGDAPHFTRHAQTAHQFGVHEVFLVRDYTPERPFDVPVQVTFTPPLGQANAKTVEAFYDGGNVWRAREAGVKCIGLTNEPASELAQAVDVLVPTQAVEPPRGSYAIAPRICQLAVLDALFGRVGRLSN